MSRCRNQQLKQLKTNIIVIAFKFHLRLPVIASCDVASWTHPIGQKAPEISVVLGVVLRGH